MAGVRFIGNASGVGGDLQVLKIPQKVGLKPRQYRRPKPYGNSGS
jgi:hypothetical protein